LAISANASSRLKVLALSNKALERDPQNLSAQIGIGVYHAKMGARALDTGTLGRIKAEEIVRLVVICDPTRARHFYLALALNVLCCVELLRCGIPVGRRRIEPSGNDQNVYLVCG
jgi:hypothetical protein